MKHGLKQEIKRGLSVLMAASMVASSALPVMAEEVVEEAVEVEAVSEEVADAEADLVVDVVEDADVVEEVVDGEVVVDDAAEGTVVEICSHPREKQTLTPIWETKADGQWIPTNMKFTVSCSCGADLGDASIITVNPAWTSTTPTTPAAGTNKWRYTYIPTQAQDGCEKDKIGVVKVIEDYTDANGNYKPFVYEYKETVKASHDFTDALVTDIKEATCTDYGTYKQVCKVCGKTIDVDKTVAGFPADDATTGLAKKVVAKGHVYTADVKNVTWTDNYKKAWLKMTCATCGHSVDVNITKYIKMYVDKNKDGKIDAGDTQIDDATQMPTSRCDEPVQVIYTFTDGLGVNELLALANERDALTGKQKKATDTSKLTSFAGKVGIITIEDDTVPTVKEGNDGVSFEFAQDGDKVYAVATIKCNTCTTKEEKALNVYHTHVYSSKVDYTKGATKKPYPVKVEVVKEKTTVDDSCGSGKQSTTVYSAVLTLNGVTYKSTNTFTVTEDLPGYNHSFSGKVSNELAIKNDKFKAATCTEEGYGEFYCEKCKNTYFMYIPMLAHEFIDKQVVQEGKCTNSGTQYKAYCNVCNKQYTFETAKAPYDTRIAQWNNWTWEQAVAGGYESKFGTKANFESAKADTIAYYNLVVKAMKAELEPEETSVHKYEVDPKAVVWSADYKTAIIKFVCAYNANEVVTKTVKATEVVDKAPGYDTVGSAHYEAVASFTDDKNKEWTYTAVSPAVEVPATGKQETATVSISGKTVVYNGDRQYVAATTNSDVTPVVSYYKDAALTQKYSGAPYTAGTYYVKATVAASAKYTAAESEVVTLVIKKADPTVKVTPATKTVKNTKKNTINIKVTQKNKGSQAGKVTYKAASSKIKVNSKGVVTVAKGTKKGTYKVTVNVKATTNYNAYTKTIKITVK